MTIENNLNELEQLRKENSELRSALLNSHDENHRLRKQVNECSDQADQLTEVNRLLHELTIENNQLRKQMDQLKEPLERLEQLDTEKHALTKQLVKATEEAEDYHKKYEENKYALQKQHERLAQCMIELEELNNRIEAGDFLQGSEYDLYVEAQEKISMLTEQNDSLKKETARTQQEIGEVLLSARKQASRTIEDAQMTANQLVKTAKLEVDEMSNQAKRILMEVDESKETVLTMYEELQDKVGQLAKGTLQTEGEKRRKEESTGARGKHRNK